MEYVEFFKKAKEKNIKNIQVTEKHNIEGEVELIDGEIDTFNESNNISYNIKADIAGKTYKVSTNYLDDEIIDLLLMKSDTTDIKYEDDYLEDRKTIKKNTPINIDISNEIKKLKALSKLKNNYKEITKLTTYYIEVYTNTRIINSNGVDISTDTHQCHFYVESLAKNNNDFTTYTKDILKTSNEDIDFEKIIKDTMEKAIIQSNKESLETKKYNIILESNTASNIIKHIIPMISSESIRNKVSCLENRIDKKIFSDKLTIIEDPTNKDYPGFRLFDDEGTLTKKKTIIDKGVLKNYLYNIKEAKIKNIKSTANGYGDISTKNMYVVEGDKSLDELFKDMKNGIYITDFMGSSNDSINTVNGDISLQVFGFIVKDGKLIKGIEPCIMTTTIFELLSNIESIGNDLTFTNTMMASPSIYIKDISIAR